MTFEYDAESDMLYVRLAAGITVESEEVSPGVVLDYGEQSELIGFEIEDASKRVDLSRLEISALPLSDLIFSRATVMA